jgi:acetoin utilization protein AcuC
VRTAAFVYDDLLTRHVLRDDHVMVPTRLRYTYELLEAMGAFQLENALLVPPERATVAAVASFHTPEYVDAVEAFGRGDRLGEASRYGFSDHGDNPVYPGVYDAAIWSTGASVTAAQLLLDGRCEVAANFSGGLHHAMPDHASGFCTFNDPVIAINHLLQRGLRVAYVDIDCHHGDGVQHAFYETDRVLTISIHESGQYLFPGTGSVDEVGIGAGRGFSVNVPLYPNTGDGVYLWALREVVPPLIGAFKPDALVTQLGIDTHFQDPITHLQLTVQGYTEAVRELARLSPGRWLALGGGGYDIPAVIRAWTSAFWVMLDREPPDQVPDAYAGLRGVTRLTDPGSPTVDPGVEQEARRHAEATVARLRRLVFPAHGLSGMA